ncbi:MAG: aminoacetone oxidase family FAD-binding enzyme [Candidatus Accumulibacter sp.]|nr:aminoacetone oxidase family FAD-binding enzyme [Accumulibacter sp.]
MPAATVPQLQVAIVGGGPAGLMAAETLAAAGLRVDLFDAMPSLGRKFLMAGKGGMNITHAEPAAAFRARYGEREREIAPLLDAFGPDALRNWIHGLGIDTFVGTSGRVFPTEMKAAPLLRAWLHRLREAGARFHVRHRWTGWERGSDGRTTLHFAAPPDATASTASGTADAAATPSVAFTADAVVLALGGGSWARLGSDGRWVPLLERAGVPVAPLRPANCGFDAAWSEHFRARYAGQPVKNVAAACTDARGVRLQRQGEFVVTDSGVEGGLIYALAAPLRDALAAHGAATLELDLLPGRTPAQVLAAVTHPRGARSLSSHLQSRLGIKGAKAGLLRECLAPAVFADPPALAAALKALPVRLVAPRPLDEAISSAGGVRFEALDAALMLRELSGVFCAGEMLDWEAPTGGYLLTACFASGHAAGRGAAAWLAAHRPDDTPAGAAARLPHNAPNA